MWRVKSPLAGPLGWVNWLLSPCARGCPKSQTLSDFGKAAGIPGPEPGVVGGLGSLQGWCQGPLCPVSRAPGKWVVRGFSQSCRGWTCNRRGALNRLRFLPRDAWVPPPPYLHRTGPRFGSASDDYQLCDLGHILLSELFPCL